MKKFLAATFVIVISCGCTPSQIAWFQNADTRDRNAVVKHIIVEAAHEFGVDPVLLLRIAECESGFDPAVKNKKSSARGLFQFLDTTWESNRGRLETEYAPEEVINPIAASRVASDMIAQGSRAWAESGNCWKNWTRLTLEDYSEN